MIKIRIDNLPQKKQEYLDAILDGVALRVSILQKSLLHLSGGAIDFSNNDLVRFRAITKDIISIVGDNNNIPNKRQGYSQFIAAYLANANNLANINLNGLTQFCNGMLSHNRLELSELLICDADVLINQNQTILNFYGLNTNENIAVIKLAFDYSYEEIATEIKSFFRTNKFVSACPYCNKFETVHYTNDAGEPVESFQLDHFYDKATFPLLSYSFFNLVPSDHTCNSLNKHDTEFNDTYHLNPHNQGYIEHFHFEPIGLNTKYEIDHIELRINLPPGSNDYLKLKGNNQPNDESGELGNLNVFKIRSKYENEKRRTKDIFEKLHSSDKNIKHIFKYLERLTGIDNEASYVEWYKDKINGSFYQETFNDNSYSKFCRDIHDYYYSINKSRFNGYIRQMLNH